MPEEARQEVHLRTRSDSVSSAARLCEAERARGCWEPRFLAHSTDLALTAEETAEMVAAYSVALRQRPGDMALSATTCYVLGVDGTVLLSTPLRP